MVDSNRVIKDFPVPNVSSENSTTPYRTNDYSKETKDLLQRKVLMYINVCKAIIIGDVAVGKTTLVHRFCAGKFERGYRATVGVDFEIERFKIHDVPFNLQIWDTAGQERFRCIAQAYYRNANVIVIVFDMTNEGTLEATSQWLDDALRVNVVRPFVFLVGTKLDLLTQEDLERVEQKGRKVAVELQAEYWSVSANTGHGVIELFNRMVGLSFDHAVIESIKDYRLMRQSNNRGICLSKPKIEKLKNERCCL